MSEKYFDKKRQFYSDNKPEKRKWRFRIPRLNINWRAVFTVGGVLLVFFVIGLGIKTCCKHEKKIYDFMASENASYQVAKMMVYGIGDVNMITLENGDVVIFDYGAEEYDDILENREKFINYMTYKGYVIISSAKIKDEMIFRKRELVSREDIINGHTTNQNYVEWRNRHIFEEE